MRHSHWKPDRSWWFFIAYISVMHLLLLNLVTALVRASSVKGCGRPRWRSDEAGLVGRCLGQVVENALANSKLDEEKENQRKAQQKQEAFPMLG